MCVQHPEAQTVLNQLNALSALKLKNASALKQYFKSIYKYLHNLLNQDETHIALIESLSSIYNEKVIYIKGPRRLLYI